MNSGSRSAGTDDTQVDSEDNLQFATSYKYTVIAENAAGVGGVTSTSLTTVANVDPVIEDECDDTSAAANNHCASLIDSDADGEEGGFGYVVDMGAAVDGDETALYHTYVTAHDGYGRLSPGGTDADGVDVSGTTMTITLDASYSDHETYTLDGCWSGDLELSGGTAEEDCGNQFDDGNASTVTFDISEANSGSGSDYTFNLDVTDNNWRTNEDFGSNSASTSITVTILPEPNEDPVAVVSVPGPQDDAAGSGYWQVPHNGNNEYDCNDLVEWNDCDDNKASVKLSHVGSGDPDCSSEFPLCEENDRWWSEAVMGMSYNDLNDNGQYDEGEPCDDGCLWDFSANGIAPAVNDGPAAHTVEHEQRHSGGGGNIWTLTVQDYYGAENTTAVGFYVLQEPNTRAYTSPATDASSGFEFGDEAQGNLVHYLDEGTTTTAITVNTGTVWDDDGDNIIYTTTLNGNPISDASGDCDGSCDTGSFTEDLGVGTYTVTTCAQDSYEGYEYLQYASNHNSGLTGATADNLAVNMTDIEPTSGHHECTSFSFEVIDEPAAVDVNTLGKTDQGMSWITMSWNESNHTGDAQISELANNAIHYVVERTQSPTDVNSWSSITTLKVVREYQASNCDAQYAATVQGQDHEVGDVIKSFDFDNWGDDCQNPTGDNPVSDDGEWYYMGVDADRNFHFLDAGLESNSTYFYRVFAINSAGRSSGIGNVLEASTEAKPEMSFSRDMSAEIYASGETTNTMTASFDDANGLGGHNVNSVSSSYTTYEGTTSNSDGYSSAADGVANNTGANEDAYNSSDFSYLVTAWETDHGQSIEVCFTDAGDYYGHYKEGGCLSTATFTGSQETLHKPFNYEGWHVFGSPLYKQVSMDDLFSIGLPGYSAGSDYVWFNQAGAFGGSIDYRFGEAFFLGLNHDLVSFTMTSEDGLLTSHDGDLGNSFHNLSKGWNLVSSKLVRPVDVASIEVHHETANGGISTSTWAEAQLLGLVSGEVLGTNETSNFESNSFYPWTGFWIHVSTACSLTTAPHAFDVAKEDVISDEFTWNMNIEAQPIDGEARGDIIKLGLSENASNEIKDGEDTEDIPVITMADSYLDIYMKESNGMTYWKNTKEMISPEEGQAWVINGYSANSNSDVRLSWSMDELDIAYDVKIYINGNAIDMREEASVVISSESLNNITVVVGNDPIASGLATPAEFALTDAYPNPFNPVTSMQLALDADGYTSVKVYNLMGQIVDVIHEGMLNAGFHKLTWNAEVIPSGVYLVKVEQGDKLATQKVMLMK
jgi:hypothetical protein